MDKLTLSLIKKGCGNESNSSSWKIAYCEESGEYFAMLSFCSYAGSWCSIYKISKEACDMAGSFEDDGYRTEEMLRKGEKIYLYDNEQNYPEPVEMYYDEKYRKLCDALFKLN